MCGQCHEVFRATLVGDSECCIVSSAAAFNSVEGHRLSRRGIVGQNWAVPKPDKLCRLKRRIHDYDAAPPVSGTPAPLGIFLARRGRTSPRPSCASCTR